MTDLSVPTCPTCGWEATQHARHLWQQTKARVHGPRMRGLVVRCAECGSTVPHVFTADELDAA